MRTLVRSTSGRSRKKRRFSRSLSRSGACADMLIAFRRGFDLSFAGHTATQRLHPVQSSAATWIVYLLPLKSGALYSVDLNVAGAAPTASPGYTLARIAACGHTIAHLLHWMHR